MTPSRSEAGQSPRPWRGRSRALPCRPMPRTVRLTLRLTPQEAAVVDEHRGGLSRSGYVRSRLLDSLPNGDPGGQPSHYEALRLLREAALAGSVTARIGYERAVRSAQRDPERIDSLEEVLRES